MNMVMIMVKALVRMVGNRKMGKIVFFLIFPLKFFFRPTCMNLLHVGLANGRQRTKVRFMLQRHHYGMEFIDGYDFQLSVNLSTFALHSPG